MVEDPAEIREGDLIFLFGLTRESGFEAWKEIQSLWQVFRFLEGKEFEAAALVTGTEVYGKLYGKERAIREEEMGYVSHLLKEDTAPLLYAHRGKSGGEACQGKGTSHKDPADSKKLGGHGF